MKKYDYLVVGAGISGATIARLLTDAGKSVLVVEQDNIAGGNCKTVKEDGIIVHVDGPHIFHTDDEEVWKFVNRFAKFDEFVNSPLASYDGELYPLPFNLNTFEKIFGTDNVDEIKRIIAKEIADAKIPMIPTNLEEQAISLVGTTVYKILVKDYTEKQWGRPCKELSPDIIKRLPLRWERNNNYFNDKYQGIPRKGYTEMINEMLTGIDRMFGVKFIRQFELDDCCYRVIYTGQLDKLCGYCFGELEWRSLRFDTKKYDGDVISPAPVVNSTDSKHQYTRVTEHKQFMKECKNHKTTVLSFEYPVAYTRDAKPYYPINNARNNELADKYKSHIEFTMPNVSLLGRLATYRYLDMDDAIIEAMKLAKELTK